MISTFALINTTKQISFLGVITAKSLSMKPKALKALLNVANVQTWTKLVTVKKARQGNANDPFSDTHLDHAFKVYKQRCIPNSSCETPTFQRGKKFTKSGMQCILVIYPSSLQLHTFLQTPKTVVKTPLIHSKMQEHIPIPIEATLSESTSWEIGMLSVLCGAKHVATRVVKIRNN